MSFFNQISNFGKSVWNWISGDSISANIAKTVAAGFALNQLTKSINRDQKKAASGGGSSGGNTPERPQAVDPGVRLQLDPDPETKIPVVYGTAILGGKITDVGLTDTNMNLYVCMSLSLKTGTKIDGSPSVTRIKRVFMDEQELLFQPEEVLGVGFLADRLRDAEGRFDERVRNLIAMNFYTDGSSQATAPGNLSLNPAITGLERDARTVMLNWSPNHFMSGQTFVIVQVVYNREAGLDRLPQFRFEVENSMTEPGDVLYDYITNTVYGLGLEEGGVYVS